MPWIGRPLEISGFTTTASPTYAFNIQEFLTGGMPRTEFLPKASWAQVVECVVRYFARNSHRRRGGCLARRAGGDRDQDSAAGRAPISHQSGPADGTLSAWSLCVTCVLLPSSSTTGRSSTIFATYTFSRLDSANAWCSRYYGFINILYRHARPIRHA